MKCNGEVQGSEEKQGEGKKKKKRRKHKKKKKKAEEETKESLVDSGSKNPKNGDLGAEGAKEEENRESD